MPESVPQLIAFSAVLLGFGLVSRRLDGTPVTPPMVFAGAGLAAGWLGIVSFDFHQGHGASDTVVGTETARHVAEIALVLFLFTGAARTDLAVLRETASLPGRLLVIGLPLTIGLGGLTAWGIFAGDLEIWEAFIVGSVLAPTDAAVGAVVVSSPLLLARLREALKVEAGLNDGLAVPFFTVFRGPRGRGGTGRLAVSDRDARESGLRGPGWHGGRAGRRMAGTRVLAAELDGADLRAAERDRDGVARLVGGRARGRQWHDRRIRGRPRDRRRHARKWAPRSPSSPRTSGDS